MQRIVLLTVFLFGLVAAPLLAAEPAQVSREERDKLIAKAQERMRADNKKYSRDQLRECENLYQVANKNWRTPEAASTLKVMLEKYPDVNRTGCAALYLAQWSRGDERAARLKQAIEKHGDCWYGNGAQVGALARLYRADDLWHAGDKDAAQKFFDELAKNYPDAITHKGVAIRDVVKAIKESPATTQPGKQEE